MRHSLIRPAEEFADRCRSSFEDPSDFETADPGRDLTDGLATFRHSQDGVHARDRLQPDRRSVRDLTEFAYDGVG